MPGLFAQPKVHGNLYGLDIVTHDMVHIFLDWIHPYPKVLIDLAQSVIKEIPSQKKFAYELLDRVLVPQNTSQNKTIDWSFEFWMNLIELADKHWNPKFDDLDKLIKYLKDLPEDLKNLDLLERVENEMQDDSFYPPSALKFFQEAKESLS